MLCREWWESADRRLTSLLATDGGGAALAGAAPARLLPSAPLPPTQPSRVEPGTLGRNPGEAGGLLIRQAVTEGGTGGARCGQPVSQLLTE